MAFQEADAELLRNALRDVGGITEKKMFGGLCFMLHGNMLCGVHQGGGMARVGKDLEPEALKLKGVGPLSFTGRKMGGLVELNDTALHSEEIRGQALQLALAFVGSLPPK